MDSDKRADRGRPASHKLHARQIVLGLMVVILLGGWAARLYGLDWDQGHGLHPDERYITAVAASLRLPDRWSDLVHPVRSGLNPYAQPPGETGGTPSAFRSRPFSYGHFPLYLLSLAAGGDADPARLALVGRVLSALFDTATIALAFALGRLLYDAAAGTLAAGFVAVTALHVQLAHFAAFDPALTCFVVATLLFAARFVRTGRTGDTLAAGLCWGLAVGAKFNAALLLLPLLLAHALRWEGGPSARRRWRLLPLTLLVAGLTFGLTNPFALIQVDQLIDNLQTQAAMLRGDDAFPFTYQYHGTRPFLYPLEQQLRWGMGLPLGLLALAGWGYVLWRAWRGAIPAAAWVPLAWTVLYFGFAGSLPVKFMRYVLPLLPLWAIYGAGLVRTLPGRRWAVPVLTLVLVPTLVYALAFLNVYRGPHPWVKLSRWMYARLPSGATLACERWDHCLPLPLRDGGDLRLPGQFRPLSLDLYAPDTPQKLAALLEKVAASDYLVVASNRIYGSVARWPERYPLSRRYYVCLFEGRLGYQPVDSPPVARPPRLGPLAFVGDPFATAALPSPLPAGRPGIAPLTLRLGRADESFTVYDHPRPMLFRNVARLPAEEMWGCFGDLGEGEGGEAWGAASSEAKLPADSKR